ncbi:non-canonical purine NTP diphosphatase [Flavobacterium sp.]|uniref:non-canonical purine NTP diphosphatase n=1 Tax=Flavobacterium sp. TaxID=239 RepID=UPI002FDAE573
MKIVFASSNLNKIKEIKPLVPNTIEILSLEDIGCFETIPETAQTIEGNALLKAEYVYEKYGLPCFADDTGLEVEVLNGEPGVYSARYAGEHQNAENNMNKLLQKLDGIPNRKAQFKTVICLKIEGKTELFTGIVKGTIGYEKRGTQGFGYDPLFYPDNSNRTFAEMTLEEKAELSHRAIALKKCIAFLQNL